jgi:hypothetical protein
MTPADLIYALSSERQRAALNKDRVERLAAQQAAADLARERQAAARATRPVPARPRWVRVRVRRTSECTS